VRDGDGWTECTLGHRHWGRYGAAGLLAVTAGTPYVLMQHRAAWSHGGDTWGVPGGARGSTESALVAAQRETVEETGIDVAQVVPVAEHVADHGTWSYTTIVGTVPVRLPVVPDRESIALRWVPVDEVTTLPLLPAFAAAWPALLELLP
jgi:8-oxo-dGTP pyrophosphatase MutT (NUDIX family)